MSLGCYVGDVYCGCVRPMYADDLIPVSISVNLLQRIIDTWCEEAVLKSHALKSNIRYGPKEIFGPPISLTEIAFSASRPTK